MPSSRRKQRQLQRNHRLEHFRSDRTKGALSPPPLPESPQSTASPHPYHGNYLTPYSGLEPRATSEASHVSDVTMEDLGGAHESALEYSDTSDENNREESYLSSSTNMSREGRGGRRVVDSGESAFRNLRAQGSKSSRIVRFASDGTIDPSLAFPFDDDFVDEENVDDQAPPPPGKDPHFHPDPQSNQPRIQSWMEDLAYSFRSPTPAYRKSAGKNTRTHRPQQPSSSTMEYPFTAMVPSREGQIFSSSLPSVSGEGSSSLERRPLIQATGFEQKGAGVYSGDYSSIAHPLKDQKRREVDSKRENVDQRPKANALKSKKSATTVAAFFLMDYEAGRPPTLSPTFESITREQLKVYQLHFSWLWGLLGVNLSILVLFLAHTQNHLTTAMMHTYSITILFLDIWMKEELYGPEGPAGHFDRYLVRPLMLFLVVLGLESWIWYMFTNDPTSEAPTMASAVFKPFVFFYVSQKARDALEALLRIGRIVTRVIIIEMFLILTFAAVACRMFHDFDAFRDLSTSWLSLFELSTTVVNPSLWMPMYDASRSNAVFFIFFVIVNVFYFHSLVLSVVFQTYIQAATDIHERSTADREDAVRLAFLSLLKDDQSECVTTSSVRKTLQIVRPHYSQMKIKALMDIVDPSTQHAIDYPTFRTKIRQALNASIRTARSTSSFAMRVELIAVLVAVLNFIYVILFTSEFQADWFDAVTVSTGSAITLLGLLELVIRFNPLRIPNFTPITRLNATFDGIALIASFVSCIGIVQYVGGYESEIDYLLMGRAIDMIRVMRFFQIFRDVIRRSADVLPAMRGPIVLVVTIVHVFVYLGIGLWGGAIDVESLAQNKSITPLYYLNNFNSYAEGLVTMFNVLVVNDWHAVAEVFLYADRCSSPYFVYPFFICAICTGVFIMLNVITAFFVEAFVTKLGDDGNDQGDSMRSGKEGDDFSIRTGENSNVRRISSTRSLREISEQANPETHFEADTQSGTQSATADNQSVTSLNSAEVFSFDVYEREGFDQIMRTVAGASDQEQEAFARSICDYLEIFESLSAGREKVGYMVCCQQSMNRFGNRRFQNNSKEFVSDAVLHKIVSDMHSELLVLTSRKNFEDRCLVRSFPHKTNPSLKLEITASLLRHQPAVSLLVSRIKRVVHSDP